MNKVSRKDKRQKVKVFVLAAQSCLFVITGTVAPPGSSVPGILQAGILEWVAMSFSRKDKSNSKIIYAYKKKGQTRQTDSKYTSKTVIMRGGEYNWRAVKMHLKLRDQQFKIIIYTYTYIAYTKGEGDGTPLQYSCL